MNMYKNLLFAGALLLAVTASSCNSESKPKGDQDSIEQSPVSDTTNTTNQQGQSQEARPTGKPADAATIIARKQVPILCYHQIREWTDKDSKSSRDYIIPVAQFKAHMKMLADSGYNTILPDQLYDYLAYGKALPEKPIMLTFDDNDYDHYSEAYPELKKYGFKGVFFLMTVSFGRPGFMTKAQVKELSDAGHAIGHHTWDHHNVKKYQGEDWVTQIEKPKKVIEEAIGKKIDYFAYPFGLWNPEAIPHLKRLGFKGAFILATKRDEQDPLYTIRRIIASGYWSPKTLDNAIKNSFK